MVIFEFILKNKSRKFTHKQEQANFVIYLMD